ncbi:MAG: DUF2796 domain-containing protein [Pseudomonadota bacterium]
MIQAKALFAATFLLGSVAACGQSTELAETPEPLAPADTEVETVAETAAIETEPTPDAALIEVAANDDSHDHEHGDDHAHDDHGDDHDEHEHSDDHADHDDHDHGDDHRHGGEAHVHGAAEFGLFLTDREVSAEFRSPLYNLVGFEHEPQTPEQDAAMTRLLEQLADSSVVFAPAAAARCDTIDYMIDVERNGDHGFLVAKYLLTCTETAQLRSVDMTAFSTYSRMQNIDVVIAGDDMQAAGTATQQDSEISFGG